MSSGSRTAPSERSHYVSTLSSILPPPLTPSPGRTPPRRRVPEERPARAAERMFSDGSRPKPGRTESGVDASVSALEFQ